MTNLIAVLLAAVTVTTTAAHAGPSKPIWDLPTKQEIADGKTNMTADLKELVIEKLQSRTANNDDIFAAASLFADLAGLKDSDYYKGKQTRAIPIPKSVEDLWLQLIDLTEHRYASSLFTLDCDLDAIYAVLPRPWSEATLNHLDTLVSGVAGAQIIDPLVYGIRKEIELRYPVVHDLITIPSEQERFAKYHEGNVISHYVFAASKRSTWARPSTAKSLPPPFSPLSTTNKQLDQWSVDLKDEDLGTGCDEYLGPQHPWFKI